MAIAVVGFGFRNTLIVSRADLAHNGGHGLKRRGSRLFLVSVAFFIAGSVCQGGLFAIAGPADRGVPTQRKSSVGVVNHSMS